MVLHHNKITEFHKYYIYIGLNNYCPDCNESDYEYSWSPADKSSCFQVHLTFLLEPHRAKISLGTQEVSNCRVPFVVKFHAPERVNLFYFGHTMEFSGHSAHAKLLTSYILHTTDFQNNRMDLQEIHCMHPLSPED